MTLDIAFLINSLVITGDKVTSRPYHTLHRITLFMMSPPLPFPSNDRTHTNGKERSRWHRSWATVLTS
jgi:hypothetical protein